MGRKRAPGRDRKYAAMWDRGQTTRAFFETQKDWHAFKRWRDKFHPVQESSVPPITPALPTASFPVIPATVPQDAAPITQAQEAEELEFLSFLCPERWARATIAEKRVWQAMWKTSLRTDSAGVAAQKRIVAVLDERYRDQYKQEQLSPEDYARALGAFSEGDKKILTYEEKHECEQLKQNSDKIKEV